MRTNHAGVTEVAHIRTDKQKFDKNFDDIFTKEYEVVWQSEGYEASNTDYVTASSEIDAKRKARELIEGIIERIEPGRKYEIISLKPRENKE